MRTVFFGLFFIIFLISPVRATEPEPVIHPTMQDMSKFKNDFLSKYDEIIFLDADSKSVTEDEFFSRLVTEKRGFKLEIVSTSPKRITLKLMSDIEQRAAQENSH